MPDEDRSGAPQTNAPPRNMGKPPEFNGAKDNMNSFMERLECWLMLNQVTEQKHLILISCLDGETYEVLRNLTSPNTPASQT